jgi:hypothetical protein
MVVMFVVLMLQELTQLTKRLGALGTMIRQVGNVLLVRVCAAPIVGQHGNVAIAQIVAHLRLALRKLINLVAGVVDSDTGTAVSTFNVLHRIRSTLESLVPTDRTGYSSWAMNLHVHIELILAIEFSVALWTSDCLVDTFVAPGRIFAFGPLIVAKVTAPITTVSTIAYHRG